MEPAYIPLLAAVVTAGVNAAGLVIAALVFKHNQKAQGNPLKLELYKRQLDALLRLHGVVAKVEKKAKSLPAAEGANLGEFQRSAMATAREFIAVWEEVAILLPASVHACLGPYTVAVSVLLGHDPNDASPGFTLKELREKHKAAYRNYWLICRKYTRAAKASDDIVTLLGADPAEVAEMNRLSRLNPHAT